MWSSESLDSSSDIISIADILMIAIQINLVGADLSYECSLSHDYSPVSAWPCPLFRPSHPYDCGLPVKLPNLPTGQGWGQQHTCLVYHLSQGYHQTFGNWNLQIFITHIFNFSPWKLEIWAHTILSDIKVQKNIFSKNIISKNGQRQFHFIFRISNQAVFRV